MFRECTCIIAVVVRWNHSHKFTEVEVRDRYPVFHTYLALFMQPQAFVRCQSACINMDNLAGPACIVCTGLHSQYCLMHHLLNSPHCENWLFPCYFFPCFTLFHLTPWQMYFNTKIHVPLHAKLDRFIVQRTRSAVE